MESQMRRVLAGDMADLPPVHSQQVRIFTSSTFTDTMEERNVLMENVYPRLKDYCRSKYALEFQVVDMRWGVRDEAADDHMTSNLCIQEIKRCQNDSVGPNFVTFLGQRHGFRPFPPSIECQEFLALCEALRNAGVQSQLLEDWFRLDENALRPHYVLQSISSRIPHYLSKDEEERFRSQKEWKVVFGQLQALLRQAATECMNKGTLPSDAARKYFMSVTEEEIEQGVFQAPGDPNSQCLCYVRIIEDMLEHLSHALAWRFIDMVSAGPDNQLDAEAQELLVQLRDEKLLKVLKGSNIFKTQVKWSEEGGINRQHHSDYLNNLKEHFYKAMTSMIDRSMTSREAMAQNELFVEVHQHLRMAKERCSLFHGRERLLGKVQQRLSLTKQQPVMVHGPSGCGKTSIIAKCAQEVMDWIPEKVQPVIILRFLGTSPSTSSIQRTLMSICHQISINYQANKSYKPPDDFNEMQKQFTYLLTLGTAQKPLVVILDSLDQLSSADFSHKLSWLPKTLPKHCHMILSTLPQEHHILETLTQRVEKDNFIEIPVLGEDLSYQILLSWLRAKDRTLTDDQIQVVKKAFTLCGLPLYVKLAYEEVIHWRSYYSLDQTKLSFTVREVINDMLTRLNKKHGSLLVTHALGYISASKSGLGENELEDILSLDDDVLTDVFQYHVPPIRRIPPILWVRIKNDISSYLATREADDTQVVYWYHRQFMEAATSFYLSDCDTTRALHSLLADYWLGTWHGEKKPFSYSEYQRKKLKLDSPESSEDRKVAAQPIILVSDDKERYNTRKLNNLPYHLMMANRIPELNENCLFNYNWILSKIKGTSIQEVLYDIDMLQTKDTEVQLLRNVLNLSRSTLRKAPDTLGIEIMGRLLPIAKPYNKYIKHLVDQCYEESVEHNVLIPQQQCLKAPGGSLKFTLEYPEIPVVEKSMALSKDSLSLYVVTQSNKMLIWDLLHGEIVKELILSDASEPKFNVSSVSHNRRYFVCACAFHKEFNPVVIVDMEEEDIWQSFQLERVYPNVGFKDNYKVHAVQNKLLVTVTNKEAACFEIQSGKLLHDFNTVPSNMMITPDEKLVVFHVKKTNQVQINSLSTYETMQTVALDSTPLCMIPDKGSERILVPLTNSSTLQTLNLLHRNNGSVDVAKGQSIDVGKAMKGKAKIQSVSFSPDEKILLITTTTDFVLWDLVRKQHIRSLQIPDFVIPDYRVTSFLGKICTDGKTMIGTYEEFLIIWDITRGRVYRTIRASSALKLSTMMLSNDSNVVITTADRSRIIKVWDLTNIEEEVFAPLSLKSACRYITQAANSEYIAVRSYDPTETRLIDINTGKIVGGPEQVVEALKPELTPDGKYLVLKHYNSEKALTVWNAQSGQLVSQIAVSSISFKLSAFSSDNKYLVTSEETTPTQDVQVKLWDLRSGAEEAVFPIKQGGFSYIFFACDNQYIVLQQQYPQIEEGRKCTVLIYSIQTLQCITRVENIVRDSLYVIRNARYMLAVAADQNDNNDASIVITNISNLKDEVKLPCKDNPPLGRMTFNAEGTRSVDVTLRVISLETGKTIAHFQKGEKNFIKKNPQIWPRMSRCGHYVIWVEIEEAVVRVGHVETGDVVGQCYVHAQPLSLQISQANIVSLGTDDGRIMLLHLVDRFHGEKQKQIKSIRRHDTGMGSLYERHQAPFEQNAGKIKRNMYRSKMCIII